MTDPAPAQTAAAANTSPHAHTHTYTQSGHLPTAEASRILQRLCYHFGRKVEVRYDTQQGLARFAWGHCTMRAEVQALHFDCAAPSADALAQVREVIDGHIALFARRQAWAVQWQPACAPPGGQMP
ncbi:MAG: DUF2218 domain-containing protein [Pseudomonadota bacterium]|nr:DUF2218 domain-containing protein [Pseudomonadota bacterium]